MPEDDLALRVKDEADVEEAIVDVRVTRFRLSHDVGAVLLRQGAERLGLRTGDVDRTLPGELHVVQVQHFIVEALQGTFGDRDQTDGKIQAREPGCGLDQVRKMVEVYSDVFAPAYPTDGWNETDGCVGLDHTATSGWAGLPLYSGHAGEPAACN